jgi:tRNA G18 (ribose-2'-O)-methylase SpoU
MYASPEEKKSGEIGAPTDGVASSASVAGAPISPFRAVALVNIRSVYNTGAIFRTADGAGFDAVYLVGGTPTPVDRFGRARQDMAKTALGAESSVPHIYFNTADELFYYLNENEISASAVELDKESIDYSSYNFPERTCIIMGNEVEGLSQEDMGKCDAILEIPMRGKKESLNVSVAAGIVMYSSVRDQK